MDAGAFLKYRTAFVRKFYESAAFPFSECKRKIEVGESPFDLPDYEDDPPFLSEWIEADQSLDVLGQMSVSLLSATLQLYLKEWERNFFLCYGAKKTSSIKKASEYVKKSKSGWFNGYRLYSSKELGIVWEEGPVDVSLLEEVVLTRNRVQHPEYISALHVSHSEKDIKKLQSPFFINDRENGLLNDADSEAAAWLMPPIVSISNDKLNHAIDEVEKFCLWLEVQQSQWCSRTT